LSPAPCEQCLPLFTYYVNSGGWQQIRRSRRKKKGRRADLWWLRPLAVLVEATGGGAGGSRWPAVLFSFSLSPLCFFVLFSTSFFFFFFFILPPLSFLFSFFCSLSFCFLSSFFRRPPRFFFPFTCFYRQKQGKGTWLGRPLCCRPKQPKGYVPSILPPRGKHVGCRRLLERKLAVEQRKKSSSSSPASRIQGKKKTWVPFKMAPF